MLASVANVPRSPEDWSIWSWNHRLSHTAIREAVQKQKGINLVEYIIDPIDFNNIGQWLEANEEMHLNMTAAVGLQSHDIQDVDFKDESQLVSWISVHHAEHYDVEAILGIGS